MKVMAFDTETTGLPVWDRPSQHPAQPHLVQYTGCLFDNASGQELAFDSMIVRPNGWTIPAEATACHHITTEQAYAEGKPNREVVNAYLSMHSQADLIIGFNIWFDLRMMRIAMLRAGYSKERAEEMKQAVQALDLIRDATPLCRLPPTDKMMAAGRKTFKTPTLAEAVKAILGEDLADAHDSRADVLATMRLYRRMNRSDGFALT